VRGSKSLLMFLFGKSKGGVATVSLVLARWGEGAGSCPDQGTSGLRRGYSLQLAPKSCLIHREEKNGEDL